MPLQTFLNLPEQRRQEIIDVAIEEFALYEYDKASLSAIVKKSGVAKGSFYRYFESKKELYVYLIDYLIQKRLAFGGNLPHNTEGNFFDILVENFTHKLQFDFEHPVYSGFLHNVMQEKNGEELGTIQLDIRAKITRLVENLIKQRQQNGALRNDIPAGLMAYIVVQIQYGISDYLATRYSLNFRDNIRQKKPIFTIPAEEILQIVHQIVETLRCGIQAGAQL